MREKHTDDPLLSSIGSLKNLTKSESHKIHQFLDNIEREIDGPSATLSRTKEVAMQPRKPLYTGTIRSPEEIKQLPESEQFRYYKELPMSGVFAHARQNMAGNAREVIGGLAKFVTLTVLPDLLLFKDSWREEKRGLWQGIGMLAAGALYEGLQNLRTAGEARETEMYQRLGVAPTKHTMHTYYGGAGEVNQVYSHLLDYPPLKKFAEKPSALFNALVETYKTNWGWGSWGEVGIKRYLAEQPLDM